MSSESETGLTLFKLGAFILLIQNALWFLGGFIGDGSIYDIILYIDIVGFVLLGLGYILFNTQMGGSQQFLYAGLGIIGWVVTRVLWQFILVENLFDSADGFDADPFLDSFYDMLYAFLFSSIFLLVGAYFVWKNAGKGGLMFFSYAVVNFIAVFLIVQPFIGETSADNVDSAVGGFVLGFFLKFIIVPILGIINFLRLATSVDEHFGRA